MAFNWYSYGIDKAVVGMKADSTIDVIDSFAAEGTVYAGQVVERGTDPATQVAASTTAANVIGIAIFENKAQFAWEQPGTPIDYPEGYAVPVCTFGDVWVKVNAAVDAGDPVYIDASGEFTDSTGDAVTGMTYLTSAGADELAVVRVRL
jgi:hypothetical protein